MSIKLYRPVDLRFKISSPFGWREDPFKKTAGRAHNGIDFAVPVGTDVFAMASGPIVRAGWENETDHKQGFGLRITQQCDIAGEKYFLTYAHLSQIFVEVGAVVSANHVIGQSGHTGSSTGPHLHVQARAADSNLYHEIEFIEAA